MEDIDYNPLAKKPTLRKKEEKCIRCKKFIRKIAGPAKYFNSREEAMHFYDAYDFYVQSDDVVCNKCRNLLRALASKKNQKNASSSNIEPEEHILQPMEAIDEISSNASISHSNEMPVNSQPELLSNNNSLCSLTSLSSNNSQCSDSELSESSNSENSQKTGVSMYAPSVKPEVQFVCMPFSRVSISHRFCFLCKSAEDIQDVPFEARMQVFISRKIFIPRKNKCCKIHLINKKFYEDEVSKINIASRECTIELSELTKFMNELSDKSGSRLHDQIGSCIISEERVKALTGHTWQNIIKLRDMMTSMKSSKNRNILQALIIFLFKMRSGNSNKCISAILGLEENQVTQSVESVLTCFENEVLPKNFGINAYSRDFFLDQTSNAAKRLYDLRNDQLALIYDATYLRHQKSSNNFYQRKSYSGQKKTPLCKPFTICTTNGYVVDVAGPFTANLNDAQILAHLLERPTGLNQILKKNDIFILDRGFRDIVDLLNERGFIVLMPALKGKRSQLTTEESNASRLVTKLRWVIEAIHGIIGQKYKLLHHQFHNALLPKAGIYCKVACFLQNLFGKRLNSDAEKLEEIIRRINFTKNVKNTLANEVQDKNWNQKKVPFQQLSSNDLLDFPEMTLDDLKIFFTGSYQLSQSVSYLAEMLQDNNSLMLSYLKEQSDIIRFEVRSRHINSKTYKAYIQYCSKTVGINGIKRYCCNCANGNRTVGCCSHVAAVIYYLSHARYQSRIINPAADLNKLFDFEEVEPIIEEDSDNDD